MNPLNITQAPSPNYDVRRLPISLLIMHYTGMESGQAALERLQDPQAKVSAHYLIKEDGDILQLVDEPSRAWHAGVSHWRGISDVNSASIGIEIVNGGHDFRDQNGSLPEYPEPQIKSVMALSKDIISRRGPLEILGHSDIAPARKIDPGEHFPWPILAQNGLGLWPDTNSQEHDVLFTAGSRDRGVAIMQRGLAHIGYDARVTGIMDEYTVLIIKALQRRYRPAHIDGHLDFQTMEIIKTLSENLMV